MEPVLLSGLWAGSCSFESEPVQIVSFEREPVKQFVQKLSLQIEKMEQLSSNAKVNFKVSQLIRLRHARCGIKAQF